MLGKGEDATDPIALASLPVTPTDNPPRPEDSAEGSRSLGSPLSVQRLTSACGCTAPRTSAPPATIPCHCLCCRLASLPHFCQAPPTSARNQVAALGPSILQESRPPASSSQGPQSLSLLLPSFWGWGSLNPKSLFPCQTQGCGQPAPAL